MTREGEEQRVRAVHLRGHISQRDLSPIPPVVREEEAECVGTGDGREGAGSMFSAELSWLGMLNLRCLGDISVEMAGQQFEAQTSFRCQFRARSHDSH